MNVFVWIFQVFVNFQRFPQFSSKVTELCNRLERKGRNAQQQDAGAREFDVFLSYCWVNSATAVEAGDARKQPGSLGHGDPREIKELMDDEADMSVWIDKEQIGRVSRNSGSTTQSYKGNILCCFSAVCTRTLQPASRVRRWW